MMLNNNYNKTAQVELSARQVKYYYFKNILMVEPVLLYGRLGFEVRTLYSRPYIHRVFFCSGVAQGCKRLVHTFRLFSLKM